LLRSVPKLSIEHIEKVTRLETIDGTVPSPTDLPDGCHFAKRCEFRMERCTHGEIPIYSLPDDVKVRCVLYEDEGVEGEKSKPAGA
jgi:peptide/nickel transport system ATP-binding protein